MPESAEGRLAFHRIRATASGHESLLAPGLLVHAQLEGEWLVSTESERTELLPLVGAEDLRDGLVLQLTAQLVDGRYRARELTVNAGQVGAIEITSVLLRRIAVQRLVRDLVASLVVPLNVPDDYQESDIDVLAYRHPERDWTTDEFVLRRAIEREHQTVRSARTLRGVAEVYQLAQLASDNPAKAVEAVFRLEPRTASNWIRRARQRGHFDGVRW